MPKLSFVMPTKDRIEWLPVALQSLLGQTEKDIEIIVVNDGSEDGTADFLDDWAAKQPGVRVIHNASPMGAGVSRNIGAEAATAAIVAPCDDDDVYVETHAANIIRWFEKHPESELVNFPYVSCDYFEQEIEQFLGAPFDEKGFKETGDANYFCNPASAYRKASAASMGGYPKEKEGLTDDIQFVTNWIQAGKKIDFCQKDENGNAAFGVLHRVLPNSMMAKIRGFDPAWVEKS